MKDRLKFLRAVVACLAVTAFACERAELPRRLSRPRSIPKSMRRAVKGMPKKAEPVSLTPEQREAFGIEIATAKPGNVDSGLELLGEVEPNGDTLAHIVPRFAGIVRQVRKVTGDKVRAGEVLAVVESSDTLVHYELKTLTDGVIIAKHLTVGEAVSPERTVFLIADLSSVWVDLSIYQKDLSALSVGEKVRIHSVQAGPDSEGTISYITPVVDQTTRTATARVVLPNPQRAWLPGMFVTGHTLDERPASVTVPRTALQALGNAQVVFVDIGTGLVPREVVPGRQGETLVEILSGVSAGERVVSGNSFLVKAEMAKGEAEHEH